MNSSVISSMYVSVLWEDEKKDLIDLLKPFVFDSIYHKCSQNDSFDVEIIRQRLQDEYYFEDMPSAVIKTILGRICRRDKFLFKENRIYKFTRAKKQTEHGGYLEIKKHALVFQDRLKNVRDSFDKVLKAFSTFQNIDYIKNKERIEKTFISFFEKTGFSSCFGHQHYKSIMI